MANEKQRAELDREFWTIIGQGERARAVATGELVPVPDDAPHGFGHGRAAFTRAAWEASGSGQSPERLNATLLAAADRVLAHQRGGVSTTDRLLFAAPAGLLSGPVPLLLVVGPGDDGRNVLTVCLPGEL